MRAGLKRGGGSGQPAPPRRAAPIQSAREGALSRVSLLPADLTVSVVIPARNDAAALRTCLAALAVQTRPADEVIVVDNGSTDDSAEVARSFGVRVISEETVGIPAASTAGYDAARYDVIGRLDADSVPPPGWIEQGIRILAGDPRIDAVTGPASFYDGPRRGSRLIANLYLGGYFTAFRLALGTTPLFGSNFFLRREAWCDVKGTVHRRGLHLHDDLDLTIHLTPEHRVAFDQAITLGISFRPFTRVHTYGLRVQRGFWTLARNWPRSSPTLRWRAKLLGRLGVALSRQRGAHPPAARAASLPAAPLRPVRTLRAPGGEAQ